MKRIHIIIVLLLFTSLIVPAQTSLREGRIISAQSSKPKANSHVKVNIPLSYSNAKGVKNGKMVIYDDTIYCSHTKKQYGWFAPMDTLSKEMILHQRHFRFSKRNNAGHWLRLEAVDAYGNYVKGSLSPYILKLGTAADSDKKANSDWVEKLKTACIWEFIADYTGETIVQERAYDEHMNIIFTFSRVPIGNGQYNCSYKDCYGLPAEMRNDEDYTYGTLVRITEDQWGNDSVMQYIDAKGLPKLNSDSVAMEVYICDKYGHLLKQQSRNIDGTLAIDNWGNCGIEYEWNNTHDIVSATYMDDNWKPMRMPAKRGVNGRENVIKTNYRHDQFRRQTEEYYTDEFGNLDENALGTHRITYEFDDKGNLIKQCGYNKNGNPSPIDNSGDVIEELSFDKEGRLVSGIFLESASKPNSTPGYLSKILKEYDSNGNEILEERYSAESGTERLTYKKLTNEDFVYTKWNDGSYRIDSLDSKGRTTFVGFFTANGDYELSGERAYERYFYTDEDKKCTETEIDYDVSGNKVDVDGVCKTITVSDSINWAKTIWRYDKDNVLLDTYIHQYDKNFNRLLSQDDANAFGIKSRSGGSSSVRYYTGEIVYSQKGEFASLLGRDEFGEPDYITSNSITYYYSKTSSKGNTKYYDEDNNEVEDEKELRDKLPKVMTIEVIDSSAYNLGLRDNDVILQYGDYAVDVESLDSTLISYFKFRRDWSLRSILDAKKNKRMVVFRVEDARNNKYGLFEIKNLTGLPSEIGFLPHVRYLTKKQLSRIQGAVKNNLMGDNPILAKSDLRNPIDDGNNYIIMAFTEMYRSVRNKPYAKHVTDPAILLGACIRNRSMYWDMSKGEDTEEFENMLDSRKKTAANYPTMYFYLTKDMHHVTKVALEDMAIYTNWFDTKVSDQDYVKLLELNKSVQYELESIRKRPSTIKRKKLFGLWEVAKDTANPYLPEGQIYLDKDGTCQGILTSYGTISFNEGTAVYKIERSIDGTWYHNDSLISLKPSEDNDVTLTCMDLLGTDDQDLKNRAVAYMNSICEENKESFLKRMEYEYSQWSNDLFIISVDKNSLFIRGGSGNNITFQKLKGNPKIVNQSLQFTKSPKSSSEGEPSSRGETRLNPSKQGEDNPLLYGEWETDVPEMEGAKAVMSFNEDHSMALNVSATMNEELNDSLKAILFLSVKIGGIWSTKEDSLCIVNDPTLTKVNVDIDFDGVDDETKEAIRPLLATEIDKQKEEMAMQLLKGNTFDGTVAIEKITETELNLNGVTLTKIPKKHQIVIGRIEGETGFLVEMGYTGLFVILKWCDWDCTMSLDEFSEEFEKQRDHVKHIVLLPVASDEDGNDVFKDIVELDCPSTPLGLRINDSEITLPYYQRHVLQSYINWISNSK